MSHFLSEQNDVDMELALGVMAACPTLEEASERLAEQGMTVSAAKLEVMGRRFPERYEAARRQIAPQLEGLATGQMLDVTRLALAAQQTAISRTMERLKDGQCADPSKVARDLADVMAKNVDKRLALEGRPTQITENRDIGEIINSLVAMKVASRVDATVTDAIPVETTANE